MNIAHEYAGFRVAQMVRVVSLAALRDGELSFQFKYVTSKHEVGNHYAESPSSELWEGVTYILSKIDPRDCKYMIHICMIVPTVQAKL